MADLENSRDLISVLWSGADILRSKMDANEYKDYLLGIVFYKYLSDSFLIKVYDLIYDEKPKSLKDALEAYKEALEDESAEELKEQIKAECHYVIEPELTYTCFADFLVEWFRNEKANIIDKYLQGGQGNLSAQIIKGLDIYIPTYEEQSRIGSCFSELNNLITLHQQKCEELQNIK